jgi:hypothetical protein
MALTQKITKKLLINMTAFLIGLAAATTARADIIQDDASQNLLVQAVTMTDDANISEDEALVKVGYRSKRRYGHRRSYGHRRGYGHRRNYGHRRGYGHRRNYGHRRSYGHRRGYSS